MTPNEFKAWFDGFTEAFEGRIPTKAQWGRIKDRVAEIDGKPVTERVYVDRYWPTYIRTVPSYPLTTWTSCGMSNTTAGVPANSHTMSPPNTSSQYVSAPSFNSSQAMADLGRAEAKSLAA
jgi:hypothetical protein